MKAKDFKPGDKVLYLDTIEATVRSVEKNGVRISYYGIGFLNRDKSITERVAARFLKIDAHRQALYA